MPPSTATRPRDRAESDGLRHPGRTTAGILGPHLQNLLWPSPPFTPQLSARFEVVRRESLYQRERLARARRSGNIGSPIPPTQPRLFTTPPKAKDSQRFGSGSDRIPPTRDRFACSSSGLGRRVAARAPSPRTSCDRKPETDHSTRIPLFRISSASRGSRTATTLFQTLLAGIVENACVPGRRSS